MIIRAKPESANYSQSAGPPSNAEIRVCQTLAELRDLKPAWDRLLSQYPHSTTFCTWEWLSTWWSNFGSGRQLWVLAFFDPTLDPDALIGLAPLSIAKEPMGWKSFRIVRLMGDGSGDSDNLDIPVIPGYELCVSRSLAKFLLASSSKWDMCLFNTMPPDSHVGRTLKELLSTSPWASFCHQTPASLIPLPRTWGEYEQRISSEDRKNLLRYRRRLEARYATKIYRCTSQVELPTIIEALFRLHQSRWNTAGQPGSFADPRRRAFYTQLSAELLARNWLELWVLTLDGEIAAVQFAFRFGDRVFQLQEGYDRMRSSDRPGYVLRGEILKHLISNGVCVYDFLGGEDPYKARWGAQRRSYSQVHFALKNGIPGLWLTMNKKFGKGKENMRATLPPSVWQALHKVNVALRRSHQ